MNKILYPLLVITLVIGMISANNNPFIEDADEYQENLRQLQPSQYPIRGGSSSPPATYSDGFYAGQTIGRSSGFTEGIAAGCRQAKYGGC